MIGKCYQGLGSPQQVPVFAASGSSLPKPDFEIMVLSFIPLCVSSSAALGAKSGGIRKINYISVRVFFVKKILDFFFYLFKIFFIVLPLWFGEFLHRRSLLQVSYVLSWIFFSFFPLISTLLAPPSPDFCA